VSVRSRVAFASGVAGLVGATLLLTGRFEGSAVLALLFAWGARVAADASLLDAGPILAARALRRLADHASFAPAWAFVVAAGVVRAGSSGLGDLRGANRVAGLALARGHTISVAGAWCALIAGAVAIAARSAPGAETSGPIGAVGRVVPPVALRRLEAGAVLAQAALLATLFFGPQVSTATDALWWIAGVATVAVIAWESPRVHFRRLAALAAALAAAGLALVLAGGTP
jgi:hypothetical protein